MSQKLYEGMFLFDSNLATKDWHGLEQHVQDLLNRNGAVLEYSERWPDRRLAYEIKGCKKGTYYLTYFKAPPAAIQGLSRDCQLSERILRVLILHDEAFEELCERRKNRQFEAEETRSETTERPRRFGDADEPDLTEEADDPEDAVGPSARFVRSGSDTEDDD